MHRARTLSILSPAPLWQRNLDMHMLPQALMQCRCAVQLRMAAADSHENGHVKPGRTWAPVASGAQDGYQRHTAALPLHLLQTLSACSQSAVLASAAWTTKKLVRSGKQKWGAHKTLISESFRRVQGASAFPCRRTHVACLRNAI